MTAYRFCRTDDIGLLVDALNHCWAPSFPGEPAATPGTFKRSIRDLQVWCSSCMVAFSAPDPVGVLIGAKRPSATLVQRIAVHPDHHRQGHARHLLTSLASKLAILGPPRIVAEVPETLAAACALFSACGYDEEALLTDYVLPSTRASSTREEGRRSLPFDVAQRAPSAIEGLGVGPHDGTFLIPVTVDDLAANGLLDETHPQVCWERSVETLTARKDEIAGLAVASDERIEAYLLYVPHGVSPTRGSDAGASLVAHAQDAPHAPGLTVEIVALRSLVEDDGARLEQLLARLRAQGMGTAQFPKVHPAEISTACLEALGFRPAGRHRLYAAPL